MSLMKLSGYAATFDPYPAEGGPGQGGWMEQIDRAAAADAVAATPRVPLRLGIDGPVIGQADLSVDANGIRMDATINVGYEFTVPQDGQQWTDEGDLELAARRITSMSFVSMGISTVPKGSDE